MLTNRSRWCVVTHHKENYSLLPAFMRYYRQYFGIQRAMIFCGRTQGRTHESLKQMLADKLHVTAVAADKIHITPGNLELTISEFAADDFVLWAASYSATEFTPDSELTRINKQLYAWGESFLPVEITRTLVVDADEFLYVKNPAILESLDKLGFHFIDVIPSPVWPPKELKFSLQSWYYRRQARPIFKYGGRIAAALAKAVGRGLIHECKTFYFDRKRMANMTMWCHGTMRSLCCCWVLNRVLDDPDECRAILRDTACCYHLAMTCKEYFLKERMRLSTRLQTDPKKGSKYDDIRGAETKDLKLAERSFDRLIRHSIFPVIEDNFLLPYLKDAERTTSGD
jgi:hypothetical protein